MARFLRMPGVSADSDAAVLELWNVAAGASAKAGDAIASVETEKAVVDIELDEDAIVFALVVEDGATVPVGDPIAVLLAPGEPASEGEALLAQLGGSTPAAAPEAAAPAPVAAPATQAPAVSAPVTEAPAPASPVNDVQGERIFATPLARRVAAANDINLADVQGSGPRGRIVRADIDAAIATAAAAPQAAPSSPAQQPAASDGATVTPHSKLRALIAGRLQDSKRNAPHFYLTRHLNVGSLLALRAQVNAQSPVRVSVNDFFVKAAARALVDVPEMNVIWTDEAVIGYDSADISVAVASERGLVTPTFRGIESMPLAVLSERIKDAVVRANSGRLQQSELEGGTLSITNLGMFGVDEFAAIINPPQAAILAIGAATKRAVVNEDGDVVAADVVTVTLSVDHRPVDGVIAAKWLDRLTQLIENPLQILI